MEKFSCACGRHYYKVSGHLCSILKTWFCLLKHESSCKPGLQIYVAKTALALPCVFEKYCFKKKGTEGAVFPKSLSDDRKNIKAVPWRNQSSFFITPVGGRAICF